MVKWLDGPPRYVARPPHELLPGTLRVISVRMNYLPAKAAFASTLKDSSLGYVSRYALGRDYHKLLRQRLKNWVTRSKAIALSSKRSISVRSSTLRQLWSAHWQPKRELAGLVSTH